MKECRRCGERKQLDLFSRYSRNLDGLHSWCKRCQLETQRLRRGAVESKRRHDPEFWSGRARALLDSINANTTERKIVGIALRSWETGKGTPDNVVSRFSIEWRRAIVLLQVVCDQYRARHGAPARTRSKTMDEAA